MEAWKLTIRICKGFVKLFELLRSLAQQFFIVFIL